MQVQAVVKKYDILFIADEVHRIQSNVTNDIMLWSSFY